MVDPFRVIPAVERIDHTAIFQVEVKGVVRVAGVMRVTTNRLSHADDLAHVFDDPLACGDVAGREHTSAVHFRRMHMYGLQVRRVAQIDDSMGRVGEARL